MKPHHELLHEEESPTPLQVAFVQDSSKTILPVISGFMKGKEGDLMEINVFYDSGAQISLIQSACAEQLGLDHKPAEIVITKVGGVEEELDTKMYKVPLYDDSGKLIQTIQAVGISQISEDSVGVNVRTSFIVKKVLLISWQGSITLVSTSIGETNVKDGLVARRSPLGWVIFGSNSDDTLPEAKQVLHVRLAEPVDLTEFWKTERT